ncbi:leucine--tRNA ligase [Candidatus Woesearchaeota archaeon]|nr:leucine--tRNA ligase [Candidatus Woesearchaeota archaeon]
MFMTDFNAIQKKWQERWSSKGAFRVKEGRKKKFYVLEMFPYPSGSGLHMGHAFNYTIGDIYARFKRMRGFNVIYPMGYDSFGLPAENAAIKASVHPKEYTDKAISNFIRQQNELGLSYDWDRTLRTSDPSYYRWNQFLFLKFMEKGLVYRKSSSVNWCPKCATVLANEQVHDGKCWRHEDTEVEAKDLEQWFIRTTAYAEELLSDLEKLDWPKRIKLMQENWIGKSHGTLLDFKIVNEDGSDTGKTVSTFTTRADTVFGITYLVLAAEHPLVTELTEGTPFEQDVSDFVESVKRMSTIDRTAEGKPKNGRFLGKYFINPFTGDKCPLWVADYALFEYGTGAVMAVPAHDQRDFEFARKYALPIKIVISPASYELNPEKMARAFIDRGILVNSGDFDGTDNVDAMADITKFAEKKGWGKATVNYKLRDWLISRQRYWGTPIPVVYCGSCGIVPVPEKELPVLLPDDVKFGEGNPLATSKSFVNCKCPKCKKPARRETDTMDTFFDSSWYFLRYTDSRNSKKPFDTENANYWMPVDLYIGGDEHACMHLIYARFFTKALRDMGLVKFDEPFSKLFNQGMLHKNGVVMSKSKGNVVLPEEISKTHGIDTARLFLVSIASPDKDLEWSDEGINGSMRFINRMVVFAEGFKPGKMSTLNQSRFNRFIKGYTDDVENIRYNLAVIKLKEMFYSLEEGCSKKDFETFIRLLSPVCPHLAEEFWERLGNKPFVSLENWPEADEKKIDLAAEAAEGTAQSAVQDIRGILKLVGIENPKRITLIVSESWKYSFFAKLKAELEKTYNISEIMKAVMDKEHGADISKLVPKIVKDRSKLPEIVTSQKEELAALEQGKARLKDEFKADIVVVKAESSKDAKAKNAMPGKPAILVE